MTRSELIRRLAARFPEMSAVDVDLATRHLLEQFAAALVAGRRVEVRSFGSFLIRRRRPGRHYDPHGGCVIEIGELRLPAFRASQRLHRLLNPGADP